LFPPAERCTPLVAGVHLAACCERCPPNLLRAAQTRHAHLVKSAATAERARACGHSALSQLATAAARPPAPKHLAQWPPPYRLRPRRPHQLASWSVSHPLATLADQLLQPLCVRSPRLFSPLLPQSRIPHIPRRHHARRPIWTRAHIPVTLSPLGVLQLAPLHNLVPRARELESLRAAPQMAAARALAQPL